MMVEDTRSQDWRRAHDYYKVYDYLHDFVGCTKKQKLMDDLCDALYFAKLEWAAKEKVKFSPEVCLVTVTEPSTDEILDIGGTIPGDLFVDNMGSWFAALFVTPTSSAVNVSLKNTAGTTKATVGVYYGTGNTNNRTFNSDSSSPLSLGTGMQIGSSTTAPARADFSVNTAFSVAPENAIFSTGSGSYSAGSGTITVSGSITAGNENGTINESILTGTWCDAVNSNTTSNFALAHDATTATPFSNAKSITVQYSITD